MQPADPVRPIPPAGVFRVGLGNGSAANRARDQDVGVGHAREGTGRSLHAFLRHDAVLAAGVAHECSQRFGDFVRPLGRTLTVT